MEDVSILEVIASTSVLFHNYKQVTLNERLSYTRTHTPDVRDGLEPADRLWETESDDMGML